VTVFVRSRAARTALVVLALAHQGAASGQTHLAPARTDPAAPPAVHGAVRTVAGEPVEGAWVEAPALSVGVATDQAGRFELPLPGAAPAAPILLRITHPAHDPLELTARAAADGTGTALDLVLAPLSRFEDSVTVSAVRASPAMPVTRTDVPREDIVARSYGQEMPFLLKEVPAVTQYSDTGLAAGYSYLSLRGVPQTRMNITLDGVPLNEAEDSTLYFVNFGDFAGSVESVQVQRGVGTSSVGAASFVGSVNFESLEFADTPLVSARLGLGGFGTTRVSLGGHSGTLGPGIRLYGRAAYQSTDGFRDHSGVEQRSAFFGAAQRRDSAFWKVFGFVGREETQLAFLAVEPDVLDERLTFNPMSPEERDRFGQQFVQAQYHHAIGAAAEWSVQGYYNGAGGWYRLWQDSTLRDALLEYGLHWRALGATSTLRGVRGRLHYSAGLHASDFRSRHERAVVGGAPQYENRGFKNELNGFAKVEYDAGRWHHFADVQGRWARFRYRGETGPAAVSWAFFNPKLGTRVDLASGLSVYASVGRAGREPGRADLFAGQDNPTIVYDLTAVSPERVFDIEGGVELARGPLRLTVTAYAMEFRDEIAQTGALSEIGLPLRTNVDRSSRRGLEIDARWQPHPALGVRHTANISRSRIDEWTQVYDVYDGTGAWVDSVERTYAGVAPLLTPAYVGNLSADWMPARGLTLAALARYVSSSFLDNTNRDGLETPDWFALDASAAVSLDRLLPGVTLRVFGTNLLDNRRVFPSGYSYLYFTRDASGAERAGGVPYYYPQATRMAVVLVDIDLPARR
jgi:iron complex outermembrane receptor protein